MIHFLLITGLRKSEAFKIERKNIHLNGTELHAEPYFTLTTTKQKEEYAIAITKELKEVFQFQYNLVGGEHSQFKNLVDVNISDSENKTTVTEPKYLFLNEHDLIEALTRKRQWQNKENTSLDSAFDIIKKEMPKNMYVTSISPNTLRHTFASFGFMLGYTHAEIDVMTAHARKDSKTAGAVYIAMVVNTHRKDFELIQDAMLGKSISDKDFIARQDATSKKLEGASEEEILSLYNKGMLTSEEEAKYKNLQTNEELKEFHSKHAGQSMFSDDDIRQSEEMLESAFTKLEASLEGAPWIMGEQFTLADISWIPIYFVIVGCGYDFSPYPNVERWAAKIQERNSYRKGISDWCEDFAKV